MKDFKPYEGSEPYLFVSYAHVDTDAVMEVIGDMNARGYRIWYDEGIEVGSEWPECIAQHLVGAHLVLAFISKAYMASANCRREMHYALSKRIKVINIFLESTPMTPGMEMQIGSIFALMKYSMADSVFYEKLYSAPLLNSEHFCTAGERAGTDPSAAPAAAAEVQETGQGRERAAAAAEKKAAKAAEKRAAKAARAEQKAAAAAPVKTKKKRAGRIVGALLGLLMLAALITLGMVGHFTGFNERLRIQINAGQMQLLPSGTEAVFADAFFEQIARDYSGIAEGEIFVSDLSGIAELTIDGDRYCFDTDSALSAPAGAEGHAQLALNDLQYFTGLRALRLHGVRLGSLESLPALRLQTLEISDCTLSSLEGVGKLTELRSLAAVNCPVTELGDLRECLALRHLDLTGAGVTDFTSLKPLTKLAEFSGSNCTLEDLKTVLHNGALTTLRLDHCDLRGSFFKSIDRESRLMELELRCCKLDSVANLEDFDALTTLTVAESGETLDWSVLDGLPALHTVRADETMAKPLTRALAGNSRVMVEKIETVQ